jgi:23S rRNA pseudouridine2605 synthase
MTQVRLNKALSEAGITSRRKADRLIEQGLVLVNGKKVFELGVRVNPETDKIVVDGSPVTFAHKKFYIMFHKPKGVLTTLSDPEGRPTVADYFAKFPVRIFPVGRLDWESEGLLLLTNDGDFSNRVMHPRQEITKTYWVKVNGQPEKHDIDKLLAGVTTVTGKVRARHIEKLKRPDGSDQYDWYKVVISEGKNRQIRNMFAKIDMDVLKLQRVAIGRLKLGSLPRGEWTEISESQLKRIYTPDLPEELTLKKPAKPGTSEKAFKTKARTKPVSKDARKSLNKFEKKKLSRTLFKD